MLLYGDILALYRAIAAPSRDLGGVLPSIRPTACVALSASSSELGATLDGQRCVVDITLYVRGGHEGDRLAAYAAYDPAEHNHSLSGDNTPHLAPLTDDNLGGRSHHLQTRNRSVSCFG